MNKIKCVSLFFKVVFQLLFVALPLLLIIAWTFFPGSIGVASGPNISFISSSYSHKILHILTPLDKLFGFSISAIPMIIELYILYSLTKLFSLYTQGEIFSINNVRYIRSIAYALLVTQIIDPICEGLMGIALTWHNPPGHGFVVISLSQTNIGVILGALIVILISWIMAEGCKLREEQQLTV